MWDSETKLGILVLGTKIQFVWKSSCNSQKIEAFHTISLFSNFGSEPILETIGYGLQAMSFQFQMWCFRLHFQFLRVRPSNQ
jgi:hypothetical protein